jgi:hypothetical protein
LCSGILFILSAIFQVQLLASHVYVPIYWATLVHFINLQIAGLYTLRSSPSGHHLLLSKGKTIQTGSSFMPSYSAIYHENRSK